MMMSSGMSLFNLLVILLLSLVPTLSFADEGSFWDQRYRGWMWFEETEKEVKEEEWPKTRKFTTEEMEQIKEKNERFAKELELLKHVMIRYPDNLEHVRRYKEKEKIMLDNAMVLGRSFMMANFLNPDLNDQLENPQNLYGRRTKAEIDEKLNSEKLKQVAKEVELFLFFKGDCLYCEILEKHLARFAGLYGFKVEAVSTDGANSRYFKTHHNNKELIEKLALKQMPTVIAVTNDSSLRFELARGAVSVADLENNSLLMHKYLEALGSKERDRETKEGRE